MEQHHQRCHFADPGPHVVQPDTDEGRDDREADDLEYQVANGHLARFHVSVERGQDGQQAAAQIGAQHQTQGHIDGYDAGAGQRGSQQHQRQAGVAQDRQHGADGNFEHPVAAQGPEQGLDGRRLGQHIG